MLLSLTLRNSQVKWDEKELKRKKREREKKNYCWHAILIKNVNRENRKIMSVVGSWNWILFCCCINFVRGESSYLIINHTPSMLLVEQEHTHTHQTSISGRDRTTLKYSKIRHKLAKELKLLLTTFNTSVLNEN